MANSPAGGGLFLVRQRLDQARRTWRAIEVGSAILRGLTFLMLALLIAVLADNMFRLPQGVRGAFAVAFVLGTVYLLGVQTYRRAKQTLTDEMVARHVEQKFPDMDNRLINAVLLQKERIPDSVTRHMVASQLDETIDAVRRCDMSASTSRRPLWRWGKWVMGLALFIGIYAAAFSQHFTNAMSRLAAPQMDIAPLTDTRLTVLPGDAERLQGATLVVEAHTQGVMPQMAELFYEEQPAKEGEPKPGVVRKVMPYEGNCFAYEFTSLQNTFQYWVKAGDATSKTYKVKVQTRPRIERLMLTYKFPDYTGLASKSEETQTGNVRVLVGTVVQVDASADRPLSAGQVEIFALATGEEGAKPESERQDAQLLDPQRIRAQFEVKYNGQYRLKVVDTANVPNEPVARQVVALPDEPPSVKVLEPGKDVTAGPGDKVAILLEAKDDFSLRGMDLYLQSGANDEWKKQQSWSYKGKQAEVREAAMLNMAELKPEPGKVYSYYFKADDGRPGRDETSGKSRIFQVSIVDQTLADSKKQDQKDTLRNVIARLIAMQEGNLAGTQTLGKWSEKGFGEISAQGADEKQKREREDNHKTFNARADQLVKVQDEIYTVAKDTVGINQDGELAEAAEALAAIARNEMTEAITQAKSLRNVAANAEILPASEQAATADFKVIALLKDLLNDPRSALADALKKEDKKDELAKKEEPIVDEKEEMERCLDKLKKFKEDQEKVIALTKQLKDKAVDEFTKKDEEKLEELVQKELDWAEYFQKKANDFSDLPKQDFALASLAKEHSEIYSDVQAAAEALKQKAAEIACTLEEGAKGGSDKIEENIEKWLGEGAGDRTKWKQEQQAEDTPAPTNDLPDQLEDQIGDLTEEEDEIQEDAEDTNANNLAAMDKGIGWDTADGPLASMSAKGVTGNKLPNQNELGGRSGEGRTGQSSGQMVEDTATGKGGRKTPSRKTPDPFEAGFVKDTAPEPPTGATGGGKSSGVGAEGFQGDQLAPAQKQMRRKASQQQQLMDKVRRAEHSLTKAHYPTGTLPDTIKLLEQIQSDLTEGSHISTAIHKTQTVIEGLKDAKELVQKQKKLDRDRSALMPEEVRDEISASMREEVPREYRDMVDNYFRSLAEAGTQ